MAIMKTQLLNRRRFMATSGSALAAGALASPFTVTAAAGRTWRVAVIGHTKRGDYGHGLDVMWQLISQTEITAVADADATGLAAARRRLGGVQGFFDYRKMLAETKMDIVSIAPRYVDQHHAMCLAAIAAGARGIYMEKPFCRTPREADEIVAACTEKNVKLAVAHRNRYHPVLPVIKQLLAGGEIGTLLEIRARGKEDSRGGAQDLWVLGSHLFNLAGSLAGPPTACSAAARTSIGYGGWVRSHSTSAAEGSFSAASTRTECGSRLMPTPSGRRADTDSKTVHRRPAACSASAVTSPPMPPPIMATSSGLR